MAKANLNLSPLLTAIHEEAERLGVSFPALLTTDLARYRWLARARQVQQRTKKPAK